MRFFIEISEELYNSKNWCGFFHSHLARDVLLAIERSDNIYNKIKVVKWL